MLEVKEDSSDPQSALGILVAWLSIETTHKIFPAVNSVEMNLKKQRCISLLCKVIKCIFRGVLEENKWQTANQSLWVFFILTGPNKRITAGKAKSGFKKRLISANMH